jgi:hypothetical protein
LVEKKNFFLSSKANHDNQSQICPNVSNKFKHGVQDATFDVLIHVKLVKVNQKDCKNGCGNKGSQVHYLIIGSQKVLIVLCQQLPERVLLINLTLLSLAINKEFASQHVDNHRKDLAVELEELKFPKLSSSFYKY